MFVKKNFGNYNAGKACQIELKTFSGSFFNTFTCLYMDLQVTHENFSLAYD